MSSGSSAYHTRQPESLGIKRDVSLESLSNPENAKKNAEAFQPLWYTPPKGTKGAKTSPKLADGKQWERCKNMIMEYDSTVMDNWKTDIQNQLVVVRSRCRRVLMVPFSDFLYAVCIVICYHVCVRHRNAGNGARGSRYHVSGSFNANPQTIESKHRATRNDPFHRDRHLCRPTSSQHAILLQPCAQSRRLHRRLALFAMASGVSEGRAASHAGKVF